MRKLKIFNEIRNWAKERELDRKGDEKTQFIKLLEEVGELSKALIDKNEKEVIDAIGDIVIVLTNFVLISKIENGIIERCVYKAFKEIKNRKGKIINNTFVKSENKIK